MLFDLYPSWPGHSHARTAADKAEGQNWKGFYESNYGIEVTPEACRRVAREMADRQLLPAPLGEVANALSRGASR